MNTCFSEQYFTTRCSVRNYDRTRRVDPALIDRLLEEAAHAPNTGNMQLYSVIVTDQPDEIARLAPTHFSQPAIVNAPVALTFCLDLRRYHRWCVEGGAQPGMGNLQGYTWAVMDTAIFAQQFVTLAELNGLGTCYLGTTTYNAPQIAEILQLPSGVVPLLTVTAGYPAEKPEVSERLPVGAVIHHGRYNDPSDAGLKEIYSEKENMESYQKFVKENGKPNLASLYAEVRYPREANEHFSAVLKGFLKNNGIEI